MKKVFPAKAPRRKGRFKLGTVLPLSVVCLTLSLRLCAFAPLRETCFRLRDDHRAGAFIGEDFGQERVAFGPADDVGAVDATAQEGGDVL